MKAINLYIFSRIKENMSTAYQNILAQTSKKKKLKKYEFKAIKSLVDIMIENNLKIDQFENFFVSFVIEQIGKEFDLLKIEENTRVLNIELKSEDVGSDDIREQLEKNYYYLKYLAPDIYLYTFIESTKKIYKYTLDGIQIVSLDELKETMKLFQNSLEENIERLFKPNNYLISPLNTTKEFLENNYFLTLHQCEIKKNIIQEIFSDEMQHIIGITGNAGTGKTLLLYDIVKEIAKQGLKCCVIHSGILCEGHIRLIQKWKNVNIIAAKELNNGGEKILERYRYIFVDESQRIYISSLEKIMKEVNSKSKTVVFSYDFQQYLSNAEWKRNIPSKLKDLEGFKEYKLTDRIRTSKEISSFTRTMMNLNNYARGYMDYSSIDVLFANNIKEAKEVITLYRKKEYTFITYTKSQFRSNSIDVYHSKYDTHHVIGQEYDNVLIVMDDNFRYDKDRRIQGKEHPNPDYLFYQLMYQAISRARKKLCVLVVKNYTLFSSVLNIKYEMLSKYQYKENRTNRTLSIKKLNNLTKLIKDILSEIERDKAITILETIDMINEELMEAELKEKVVRNGVKLLKKMQDEIKSANLNEALVEYCEYIKKIMHSE